MGKPSYEPSQEEAETVIYLYGKGISAAEIARTVPWVPGEFEHLRWQWVIRFLRRKGVQTRNQQQATLASWKRRKELGIVKRRRRRWEMSAEEEE